MDFAILGAVSFFNSLLIYLEIAWPQLKILCKAQRKRLFCGVNEFL